MLYDTETIPVKSVLTPEYVTVKNGKITSSRMVFDQTLLASFQGGIRGTVKGGAESVVMCNPGLTRSLLQQNPALEVAQAASTGCYPSSLSTPPSKKGSGS